CFHPTRPELYVSWPRKWTVRRVPFDAMATPLKGTLDEAVSVLLPKDFIPSRIAISRTGRMMAFTSFSEHQVFVTAPAAPEKVTWLKNLRHLSIQHPAATATGGGTLALSDDGRWAACGGVSPQGTKVWNAQSGEYVATLSSENTVVQFSPDDRCIAAGGRAYYQLFRVGDWRDLWRVPREGSLLTAGACAFSPDGSQLAVAKSPQMTAILDTATGRE